MSEKPKLLRESPELLHVVVNNQGAVLATYSIREYAEDGCARINVSQPCRIVSYARADRRSPLPSTAEAPAASDIYEELLRTRGWAKKMHRGLDGLLDWVMEAHKEDGWDSLSTPDAVVVAYGALTDANIPAFALDLSIEPPDVRERLAHAVRDMIATVGKPNTIVSLQTHAHWLSQPEQEGASHTEEQGRSAALAKHRSEE